MILNELKALSDDELNIRMIHMNCVVKLIFRVTTEADKER